MLRVPGASFHQEEKKEGNYTKRMIQTTRGGQGWGEVGSDRDTRVNEAIAVFREMAHRLSVVERGRGNGVSQLYSALGPHYLACRGSRRPVRVAFSPHSRIRSEQNAGVGFGRACLDCRG